MNLSMFLYYYYYYYYTIIYQKFTTKFKMQPPKPHMLDKPDLYFPMTHTCFFSISLPPYSSAQVGR